ncbi:hypothetical protein Tco_0586819 [Tanacetum coccineum]
MFQHDSCDLSSGIIANREEGLLEFVRVLSRKENHEMMISELVDYDEEYHERMMFTTIRRSPSIAMLLLTRPLLINFSNPTNYHFLLRLIQKSSSVLGDRVIFKAELLVMLEEIIDELMQILQRVNAITAVEKGTILLAYWPEKNSTSDQNSDDEPSMESAFVRKAISECPKLYVASRTGNIEIPLNVRDSEETLEDAFKRMNATSSVKRPKSRDSHVKTNALDVSKNEAKKEAVYVRKNKQTDNTVAKVVSNKENIIDVAVANASKAKTLLCVSCMQSVLISCLLLKVAKHKLNVLRLCRKTFSVILWIPKSSETTFVAPKTRFFEKATQSKTLDTTSVASKSKIDEASVSKARDNVSSACKKKKRNMRDEPIKPTFMLKGFGTSDYGQKWEDDLLTGESDSNLYTIQFQTWLLLHHLSNVQSNFTNSWLWHRRLGKARKASHPSKLILSDLLQIGITYYGLLCGPLRVASGHGTKYVLVISGDFSRFVGLFSFVRKTKLQRSSENSLLKLQLNFKAKFGKIWTVLALNLGMQSSQGLL